MAEWSSKVEFYEAIYKTFNHVNKIKIIRGYPSNTMPHEIINISRKYKHKDIVVSNAPSKCQCWCKTEMNLTDFYSSNLI